MKETLLSCFLALGLVVNAQQTTFFTEDWEGAAGGTSGTWTLGHTGTLSGYPYNQFSVQNAFENPCGGQISGNASAQIIGITSDTGGMSCDYLNGSAANANYAPIIYHQIDATAYSALQLSFKWKCNGEGGSFSSNDYGELVYSLDGTTWTTINSGYRSGSSTAVSTVTDFPLPAALNNQVFYLGFRFVYDADSVQNQPGFIVDDIELKGSAASCSGTPNTPTASINYIMGPVGTGLALSSAGGSAAGGLTYQWEFSDNNGISWTSISGATATNLNTTAPNYLDGTVLSYRLRTDCLGSSSFSYSNIVTFKIDKYCAAGISTVNSTLERITGVQVADVNNTTSATTNSYDQTAVTVHVEKGNSYPFTISIANFNADQTSLWIDYNHDGEFSADEQTNATVNAASTTGTLTIPTTAQTGNTRMRIRTNNNAAPNACGISTYGEYEDYTLNIAGPVSYCPAGTESTDTESISSVVFADISNNSTSTDGYEDFTSVVGHVNAGQTYNFSAVGPSNSGDQVLVWIDFNQDGDFDDAGEQVLVTGNQSAPYTGSITIPATALGGTTRMRVRLNYAVLLGNSTPCGNSYYGQVEDYTLNISVPLSYCQAGSSSGLPMSNVTFADINNNSASTAGYADYTNVVGNVTQGQSYNFSATAGTSSSTDKVIVWIDLNQDGDFDDAGEQVLASEAHTSPWAGSITIPATASVGITRMRIRLYDSGSSGANTTSCGNSDLGQVQDYTLNIAAPPSYCTAGASNEAFEKITTVTFADINNNSTSTAGYEDFTNVVGNVTKGQFYIFAASFNNNTSVTDQVMVWIDYNHDMDFDDPGELVVMTDPGLSPWIGNVTIPTDALTGPTRMRVRLHNSAASGANSTPCGFSDLGQVEDYTLNIGDLAVSDISKSNINAYPNPVKDIFNIEAQGNIKSVKVFDASGKQLMTKEVNSAKSQIDFSKFTSGVYIVTSVLEDGTSTSTKVIKE